MEHTLAYIELFKKLCIQKRAPRTRKLYLYANVLLLNQMSPRLKVLGALLGVNINLLHALIGEYFDISNFKPSSVMLQFFILSRKNSK